MYGEELNGVREPLDSVPTSNGPIAEELDDIEESRFSRFSRLEELDDAWSVLGLSAPMREIGVPRSTVQLPRCTVEPARATFRRPRPTSKPERAVKKANRAVRKAIAAKGARNRHKCFLLQLNEQIDGLKRSIGVMRTQQAMLKPFTAAQMVERLCAALPSDRAQEVCSWLLNSQISRWVQDAQVFTAGSSAARERDIFLHQAADEELMDTVEDSELLLNNDDVVPINQEDVMVMDDEFSIRGSDRPITADASMPFSKVPTSTADVTRRVASSEEALVNSTAAFLGSAPAQAQAEEQARSECFCGTGRHLETSLLPFEGIWIQCDKCDTWCHGECVGVFSLSEADTLSIYTCPRCEGVQGGSPMATALSTKEQGDPARANALTARASTCAGRKQVSERPNQPDRASRSTNPGVKAVPTQVKTAPAVPRKRAPLPPTPVVILEATAMGSGRSYLPPGWRSEGNNGCADKRYMDPRGVSAGSANEAWRLYNASAKGGQSEVKVRENGSTFKDAEMQARVLAQGRGDGSSEDEVEVQAVSDDEDDRVSVSVTDGPKYVDAFGAVVDAGITRMENTSTVDGSHDEAALRRYRCRRRGQPKKGHVCDAGDGEATGPSFLPLPPPRKLTTLSPAAALASSVPVLAMNAEEQLCTAAEQRVACGSARAMGEKRRISSRFTEVAGGAIGGAEAEDTMESTVTEAGDEPSGEARGEAGAAARGEATEAIGTAAPATAEYSTAVRPRKGGRSASSSSSSSCATRRAATSTSSSSFVELADVRSPWLRKTDGGWPVGKSPPVVMNPKGEVLFASGTVGVADVGVGELSVDKSHDGAPELKSEPGQSNGRVEEQCEAQTCTSSAVHKGMRPSARRPSTRRAVEETSNTPWRSEPLSCGQRVSIRWQTTWYSGTVKDTRRELGRNKSTLAFAFRVEYDDGDRTWHHYHEEEVHLLETE